MYKFLSIFLGVCLFVAIGIVVYQQRSAISIRRDLNNQITKFIGKIQETETAYSIRALESEDLKVKNKELQKIIDNRDEEVAALGELALNWKKKYFDIKDATGTVVGRDGVTVVEVPIDCQSCLRDLRLKVDFDKTQDYLRISGYTLTNPAEAKVEVSWERQLKLTFVLAKKDKTYRLYFDSNTPDLVPGELTLKVDSSVLDKKWYEKIGASVDLSVGSGVQTSIKLFYDILPDLYVGPNVVFYYDGLKLKTLYGASVGWYIFR